jgi:alpha-ribazole phosphatase
MDERVVVALFRHGVTEENKRKAYLGWNDSPLCAEIQNLSTNKRYDLYFSSDLHRCVMTAKRLFPAVKLNQLEELREMNFGEWEGKTYDDLKEDFLYQRWLSDPSTYCPPKGETFLDFTTRVQEGWRKITKQILAQNSHRCAVITHGGVIRYLLSKYALEQKEFWHWQSKHDQGFELVFERETLRRGERCTLLQEVPLMANGHG